MKKTIIAIYLFSLFYALCCVSAAQEQSKARDLYLSFGKTANKSAKQRRGRPGSKIKMELMRNDQLSLVTTQQELLDGDRIAFRTAVNYRGYLMVTNVGTSGKVNVLYAGQVSPTNDMRIPAKGWIRVIGSGIGLFYFAGHGVQVDGVNYLAPVGARVEKEQDVKFEMLDIGKVTAEMEAAKNGLNILILDACRNNPFMRAFRSPSSGLAPINAPSGTYIAFATAPGTTASDGDGENGLYTHLLGRHCDCKALFVVQLPFFNVESKQRCFKSPALIAGALN
jgi:hypothetical protein